MRNLSPKSLQGKQHMKLTYREISSRPDLRDVEGVESKLSRISILRLHNLHLGGPFHLLTLLHGFPQISLGKIRILARHADSFFCRMLPLSVLGDEMKLDVDELALFVDPAAIVSPSRTPLHRATGTWIYHLNEWQP